jgi:ABC-type lipoprotein release transport system permease subunit
LLGIVLAYGASSYFEAHGVPMGRMEVAGVLLDGNLYTKVEAYQFVVFPVYVTLLTLAAAIYPAIFASRIVPSQALQRAL